MKLKEEYNETATLKMLEKTFYKDDDPFFLRDKISFDEIYAILGYSKGRYPSSTDTNAFWKHFPTYQAQSMWSGERKNTYDTYVRNMSEAYNSGDYFHFIFNEGTATERMIINVTNQSSSLKLSQFLLSLQIQAPLTGNYQIPEFKIYLKKHITGDPLLKNDKMVIYYERSHRDRVYGSIVQAAKQCKIRSTDFSSIISAFYHLATDDDDTYPVGIAVEKNSTISFTESCANSILKQLTGVAINFSVKDASVQKNEKYKIKEKTPGAKEIFETVKKDCCKSFNEQ